MIHHAKQLDGRKLGARDGDIARVKVEAARQLIAEPGPFSTRSLTGRLPVKAALAESLS